MLMKFYRTPSWLENLGAIGMLIAVVAFFSLFIAVVYGYVHNIIEMITMIGGPITTMFIARCVGIFLAPLGIILGLFF